MIFFRFLDSSFITQSCIICFGLPFDIIRNIFPSISVATLKKSKTLNGPLKKPQKTPGQICKDFAEKSSFSWKKSNFFSEKSNFLGKKRLLWKKFLMTFFLVINSDFYL